MDKEKLNLQSQHWENNFSSKSEMFGVLPSYAAIKTVEILKKKKVTNILELGAGQGRDTLFFAENGFNVQVLDYSKSGLENINKKANVLKLEKLINVKYHDVRKSIPFKNEKFEVCFSHMLYCMAFTNKELENLSNEINRVLKLGGINIYTVRHTGDGDYKKGIHRGEDLYESGGFIINFFYEKKIRHLSRGYKIEDIKKFEEGTFPRKLFYVMLKKIFNYNDYQSF